MAEAFVCPVVHSAAGNVVGYFCGGIFTLFSNPITLVRKFNNNVDNLKKKVTELKDEKETVENYAEAVDRRGEQIEQKLRNWLTSANNFIGVADKLVVDAEENAKKCFFRLCLNPISRYRLSKKAKENSKAVAELVERACRFDLPLSHIPAPQQEVAAPVKGFEDFYSRSIVLEKILEALQSGSMNIIGVHGMPGMGKTMLAKEVKRKAEQDKLFDAVVMAFVSRNVDLKSIQFEIARGLGVDQLPNGITTQDAAERIKARLMKLKKVLIILDDIWVPGIDVEELGIPPKNEPKTNEESSLKQEYAECKILLTSRDSDVLSDLMGSQQNFRLLQLKYEEAWELLKKIVGDRAENDEIHSTAIEIVQECGGLPLAITTIANALKSKEPYEWRNAMRMLKGPSSDNFDGISAYVYSAIEVSYSHLESEKLKKTFLLCCLMGHQASIHDLLKYGVGLGLLANTIEDARDEIFTLISKLKASSLLIDDYDNNCFDMHDLIRDVAVSIACRDHHGLLLTGDHVPKEWSDMEAMKDFKWICLEYSNIDQLPDELESTQLTLFCLCDKDPSLEVPANFFKGMQRLKVLDLTNMHMSSLPSSISLLKNLHTLCLDQSVLGDIRIIGELKNLEILSLGMSDFEELPREIGLLTQLKLLDLSKCTKLKVIPPCVLAGLYKLEELYLANSFDQWEVEQNENQRNASLVELKHLKKLTTVEVCIPNIQMIPNDFFFENLKRYKILIGQAWNDWDSSLGSSRILKLHLNASITFNYLIKLLLKTTEELHLWKLNGVKNVVDELNGEGFRDLKYLYVHNAAEVQHIINSAEEIVFNAFPSLEVLFLQNLINLEKIFQGRFKETAFNKLRIIIVECCDKVKHLFSCSIARQLLHLQEISVTECSNMEEIVDDEEQGNGNDIVESTEPKFGEMLRSLRLEHVPKLTSVKRSCRLMPFFNEQVVFPNLEELQLSSINVNTIWHTWITSSYVEKLTKLIIEGCDNLKYLFSTSMARGLVMLGHLEIRECKKMEEVVVTENEEKMNLIFPQLYFLSIKDLPKLRRFCYGNYIKFPCLSQLTISRCLVLKRFISSPTFGHMIGTSEKAKNSCTPPLFDTKVTFPKLERLIIHFMESLDKIWDNQLDAGSFFQLNYLNVNSCKELLNIFPFSMLERLQKLDKLEIWNCESLEEIFESQKLGVGQSQAQKNTPSTLMESVTKFMFPNLTHLDLYKLPKLNAFCHQMHTSEWPSLKKLEVCGCYQVQIFASELLSFPKTNGDDQLDIHIKHSLFWTSKVTFPCLEELKLEWNNNMKEIWHGQYPRNYFPKLKVLELIQFSQQSIVQPFLFQSPNLEKLVVSKAPFHEIFKCQGLGGVEKPAVALAQLSELSLSGLHELTYLWKEESNLESIFYNLKTLEVQQCNKLRNLVPPFISFKNLMTLEVSTCHELLNLIGYSTAKSMVHLTRMSISECHMLKEIVACVEDEVKDDIVFSQLKYLKLHSLPRLASFCSGNYNIEFISLEEVIVMTCPNMHIFSHGECSTPHKLQKVKLSVDEDAGFWEGNLNSTIQKMFTEKVGYYGLENLKLSEFSELIEIWNKKPQEILPFKRLKFLEVCNCNSLRYLLTSSMALGLVQLHNLKVTNCATMEQVIIGGAEDMFPLLKSIIVESCSNLTSFYEGSDRLNFPYLEHITVADCPILVTFASSLSKKQGKEVTADEKGSEEKPEIPFQPFFGDKVMLPNLEELQLHWMNVNIKWHPSITSLCVKKLKKLIIQGCDNLEYLFSSSMARGLVMLRQLEVRECKRIREIIVTEIAEEKENLIFHQLNFLLIKDLQNLVGFYSGNYILEFPYLKQLQVLNCPKLERFTIKHSVSTNNVTANTQILLNEQISLPNLEELRLCWMNVNIKCYSLITSLWVEKLEKLIIQGCDNMEYLFSSSMARGLVMLEQLEIRECKRMREIIVTENVEEKENLIFPQLKFLLIKDLQNLVGFYLGNCIVEFPSLKLLEVLNCPELKGFTVKYSISTNVATDTRMLFNEQVVFPNLELLAITHLKNLEIIWHSQLHADSFCKLKSLIIVNCEKLSIVFPSADIQGRIWKSLEELIIYECGSLEVVFEIVEFNVKQRHVVIDTKLRVLTVNDLPRLKHIWNKDPHGTLTFHNLKSVIVRYCESLQNLFPTSIGKRLLQLQELHLFRCGVEEIVSMGEQGVEAVVSFEFPQVSSLKLEVLPRLQCFYPGKHTTVWPMLKEFYFSHFNKLQRTNGHGQLDFPIRLSLFSMEKVIPQLEQLSLTRHDIALICEHQLQDLLVNIKLLRIQDYLDDELDVLPITFLQSFCHLENLDVSYCNFKELFPSKGEVEEQKKSVEIETLSKIKTLNLDSLPYLRHICSHDSSSVLQNLESLEVFRCESLISLSTSAACFRNLIALNIILCPAMISLVSVSIVQNLVQLERITVSWCQMLTDIIGNEGDGMQDLIMITFPKLRFLKLEFLPRLESFCSGNFTFTFPYLEEIIVNQCPKLKIFSEGDLNTPLLQRVELIKREDKWRWAGDLNTTIQRMYMEKVGYARLEVLILSDFTNFPELMDTRHIRNPQELFDFRQLQVLEICNCTKFRYLLTASMALGLVQLMQLIVKNCGTMEQVIMGEGAENQMEFSQLWLINLESCSDLTSFYVGSHSLVAPSLNHFIVKDCPKFVTSSASTSSGEHSKEVSQYLLSSKVETPTLEILSLSSTNIQFIWDNSILEISSNIQNLRKLCVEGCGSLKYLLTSSMIKSFERLNWLEICNCKMMEEVIFTEELVEEERMCKNFFPNLEVLLLQDLPKLTRFCFGNYLKFPFLWKLKISKCPVLKTFISSFISRDMANNSKDAEDICTLPLFNRKVTFPKLERLIIEYMESLNKIWNDQLEADSFYQLTLVSVVSCEKLLNIFPFSMVESLQRLEKLQIWNCGSLEEIIESQEHSVNQSQAQKATLLNLAESSTKCVFPKLTDLDLHGLPKLKGFFLQMHNTEWPSLKKLWVYGCHQMQIFASKLSSFLRTNYEDDQPEIQIKYPLFWMNKTTFPCLEELILENNDILKEIWNGQYPGDYFPKLKVLKLIRIQEQSALPSFFLQSLPNLEKLAVSEASFDEIFQCERLSNEERPTDASIQLRELKLSKLYELTHLWKEESDLEPVFYNLRTLEVLECCKLVCLVPSIVSFKNLQSLKLSRCHGLVNLVRNSTAKSLVHLTRMSITDCDMVEEIIVCLEDDVKDGIVFTKLKYLQLCGLPRLASFGSVKCKFEFPSLEELVVMDCPSMHIFSKEISTPKLHRVKLTENEDEGFWEGNLNSTIQFMQKSGHDSENQNADGSEN